MGVPTVSVFAGPSPAVDEALIERGLLRRIEHLEDFLPLRRRNDAPRGPASAPEESG